MVACAATGASTGNVNAPRYESFMGLGPKRIGQWEHWSNPDAATHITGINFYEHPRSCMQRLNEMYPRLELGVPAEDTPLPRLDEQRDRGKGRWGHEYRDHCPPVRNLHHQHKHGTQDDGNGQHLASAT